MKRLSVLLLLILAAGCASDRYRPTYLDNGDGYDSYARSYPAVRHTYGYDSLYLYGMYPWWTSGFYSPWFYPYRFTYYHPFYDPYYGRYFFAGWSPGWPYYGGFYDRYAWAWAPYRPPPVVGPGASVAPGSFGPGGLAAGDVVTRMDGRGVPGQRGIARGQVRGYPGGKYSDGNRPVAEQPAEAKGRFATPPGVSWPTERVVDPVGRSAPYGRVRPGLPEVKSRSVVPNVSAPSGPRIRSQSGAASGPASGRALGPSPGPRVDRSSGDRPRAHRER